jgi:hypothetical protein
MEKARKNARGAADMALDLEVWPGCCVVPELVVMHGQVMQAR